MGMTFDYVVKYSPKRKTLGLVVERDKSVVVMAPEGTSEEVIEDFVHRRRMWIYEKVNFTPKLQEQPEPAPFVSGKSIPYLGKNYKLDLVPDESLDGIRFRSKFLLSKGLRDQGPELLEQWYKSKAKAKLPPKVERFAKQMGVDYSKILVSDMKYSWGSCSPGGTINLNWRLVKMPHFVIDYVIVHELAHLIELNHSPRFWNIVRVQLPRFEEAREWLRNK